MLKFRFSNYMILSNVKYPGEIHRFQASYLFLGGRYSNGPLLYSKEAENFSIYWSFSLVGTSYSNNQPFLGIKLVISSNQRKDVKFSHNSTKQIKTDM